MRLLFVLAALVPSAHFAQASVGYPKCTPAQTQQFLDNLDAASNGCTANTSYAWSGANDPTSEQRREVCECTVGPLEVPKCSWLKETYNVSVSEQFGFVYSCATLTGKPRPPVTEVSTPPKTSTPRPVGGTCTASQMSVFKNGLKSVSACLAETSYDWAGPNVPTTAQYAELCKCAGDSSFRIPSCSLTKDSKTVSLSDHYNWIFQAQCPKQSNSGGSVFYPKCTDDATQKFLDNLSKASGGCTKQSSYEWGGDHDPTSEQRREFCNCAISALEVPKCSWVKERVYRVSVKEHFNYAYQCKDISGKPTPTVTEVSMLAETEAPTEAGTEKPTVVLTRSSQEKSSSNAGVIGGAVGGGVMCAVLIVGAVMWRRKRTAKDNEVSYELHSDRQQP